MTGRVIVALGAGCGAASIVATVVFLLLSGDLDIVRVPRLALTLPLIGAVATAPGWIIAMLALLPVVTHLAARKPIARGVYYAVAVVAGGVAPLASPLGIITLSDSDASAILPVLLASGAMAGLCFAAVWHRLILQEVAARRDDRTGTLHG